MKEARTFVKVIIEPLGEEYNSCQGDTYLPKWFDFAEWISDRGSDDFKLLRIFIVCITRDFQNEYLIGSTNIDLTNLIDLSEDVLLK